MGQPTPTGDTSAAAKAVVDELAASLEQLRASLPLMLTVTETAEVARCSPTSVRRAIASGHLPFNQRQAGGAVYVPRDAVLSWAFSVEVAGQDGASTPRRRPAKAREMRHTSASRPATRRPPLRVALAGTAPDRLTPEAMRAFAARHRD